MKGRPLTSAPADPPLDLGDEAPPIDDTIEPGKRLIRLPADKGLSLGDRIANHITRLTWRTPLHALRLKGRFPLKLLGVPVDPVPGDTRAGTAIRAGHFLHRGLKLSLGDLDFAALEVAPTFADYLHSFAWLRDLSSTGSRADGAPIAEAVVRHWLGTHGETVSEPAWKADNSAWRILFWAAHAPLILSSSDLVYRSAVLNHLARAARHLDRVADKTRPGTGQMVAWVGIVAASLLMPGGEPRQVFGEAGLRKVLETSFYADGGNHLALAAGAARRGHGAALDAGQNVYGVRRMEAAELDCQEADSRARSRRLLGLLHMATARMGSWQGSACDRSRALMSLRNRRRVRRAHPAAASQARDWGYQRLAAGQTVVLVADAAPPPVARVAPKPAAPRRLAFEVSDGPVRHRRQLRRRGADRGDRSMPSLAQALRTTAAHSAR
jgi:uncharacterized heparinase superfamily protein